MTLAGIPGIGEILSLASALLWALALVLFRRASDVMGPATLNLYKGTVALLCIVPTMLVLGIEFMPAAVSGRDWAIMLASGAMGMGVADTLMFMALKRLGPGRYAIINCAFGPAVIVVSTIWLAEPVSWKLVAAAALIVTAILVSALPGRNDGGPRTDPADHGRSMVVPYLLGAAGVLIIAVSIVAAKPILNRTDGVWGAFARLIGGMIFLVIQNLLPRNFKNTVAAFSRGKHHFKTLPVSFIGAYACTVLWTLGMKYTYASSASVMNQLTNVMIFPFAALILKEKVQPRQVAAVAIGIAAGLLVISRV